MRSLTRIALFPVVFGFAAPTAFSAALSPGVVVYESMRNPAGGGYGFGEGLGFEIGQSSKLAGTARRITQIDLLLGNSASEEFRIRLYGLGGVSGVPSTLIWESPVQRFPQSGCCFDRETVSVAVPNVLVPDSMAWTVAPLTPNNSNMLVLTGSHSPAIGTHIDYWAHAGQSWRTDLFFDGTFGARIFAIPEPSSLGLLALGMLAAICMSSFGGKRRDEVGDDAPLRYRR